MDENRRETRGPKHHAYRLTPVIAILIGLVVGIAMYFGVMAWYFTRVDPGGGPPGLEGGPSKASPNASLKQ